MLHLKLRQHIWIYCVYFVYTAICQEFEFDLESLISENPDLLTQHSQSIRSGDDIYASPLYARDFLREFNNELRHWKHSSSLADWNYTTNLTDYNKIQKLNTASGYDQWWRRKLKEARKFHRDELPENLSRQLALLTFTSTSDNELVNKRKSFLLSTMEGIYGSTETCINSTSCLPLEPNLLDIMSTSRDPQLLQRVWLQWRNNVGPRVKPYFSQLIQVLNEAAVENGFSDYSEFWKQDLFFNTSDLERTIERLWEEVQPLYVQLHAYVRRKLRGKYGTDVVGHDGTIPAHLLGNMWAQHWPNILDIVSPYPEHNQQAHIEARLKESLNVQGLFRLASNFYTSLGLYPMTSTFWEKSMFTRPQARDVVCHASAFDMYYPGDFRIKMCAELNFDSFRTVHHEMGHVEYFMAYADQPTIYREGANAAFHEAVGDTIQLSVLSTTHLKGLGLIEEEYHNVNKGTKYKRIINNLLNMALEKLAFLPFGLLVDMWRWDVMKGKITESNYNKQWWEMRLRYQGIRSPVSRSEESFDPGAKYHIISNSPYISYFVSYIQQFQMFKSLCNESGFTGPLHECDFYGSKEAGQKLKHTLSYGSSIPWQDQLKYLTGSSQVSSGALLEYFKPLHDWLILDNVLNQEPIGWKDAKINWENE